MKKIGLTRVSFEVLLSLMCMSVRGIARARIEERKRKREERKRVGY